MPHAQVPESRVWVLRHLSLVCHHVGMTQNELRDGLKTADLAIVASRSKVHIRTLQRIRGGQHKASPLTIKAVAPVLARMAAKATR